MIQWKTVVATPNASSQFILRAKEIGEAQTSGTWTGILFDCTAMQSGQLAWPILPLAAKSTGRIISMYVINPNAANLYLGRTSPDKITGQGVEGNQILTMSDKTQMTVFCDGDRWNVLSNDGNWVVS